MTYMTYSTWMPIWVLGVFELVGIPVAILAIAMPGGLFAEMTLHPVLSAFLGTILGIFWFMMLFLLPILIVFELEGGIDE